MIQISFSEIESIFHSLKTLTKEKLPIKTTYKLVKLLKQLEDEYKLFAEQRSRIINEYGKRDSNNNIIFDKETNSIPIKEEYKDKCAEELKELNQITFKIDFSPISIDELGDIQLSIEILYALDRFFV